MALTFNLKEIAAFDRRVWATRCVLQGKPTCCFQSESSLAAWPPGREYSLLPISRAGRSCARPPYPLSSQRLTSGRDSHLAHLGKPHSWLVHCYCCGKIGCQPGSFNHPPPLAGRLSAKYTRKLQGERNLTNFPHYQNAYGGVA